MERGGRKERKEEAKVESGGGSNAKPFLVRHNQIMAR